VGSFDIPPTLKPNQRQICWSADGTVVAVSLNYGKIFFCYADSMEMINLEVSSKEIDHFLLFF